MHVLILCGHMHVGSTGIDGLWIIVRYADILLADYRMNRWLFSAIIFRASLHFFMPLTPFLRPSFY